MAESPRYERTTRGTTPESVRDQAIAARASAVEQGWSVSEGHSDIKGEWDDSERPGLATALDSLGPDDVLVTDEDRSIDEHQ